MRTSIFATLLLFATFAPVPAAEPAQGFKAFKLVQTRNVFDPNRRAPKPEAPPRSSTPTKTRTRSNSLTLTGTMVTAGKSLAFFNGSRSEYSKVIGVGDKVADFKVTSISPTKVEMERDGKPAAIEVGGQLQLEGTVVEEAGPEDAAPAEGAPATPTDGATSAAPTASPASTDSTSDLMRRMMERRAKETK